MRKLAEICINLNENISASTFSISTYVDRNAASLSLKWLK